jgi:hypothetical protein
MTFPSFDQWLKESTFANIYRHGLELSDEMDASLRRRVKAEIMSVARNDHSSRSIEGLRRLVGGTLS